MSLYGVLTSKGATRNRATTAVGEQSAMSDESSQATEKRIIIDEDWKARVQAEKEAVATSSQPQPEPEKRKRSPLPEPSFPLLLASLATQALAALGVMPHPETNKAEADLEQAKHVIDTLGILEEKTKGNLTPEEKRYLDSLLFDLRLQYVEACSKATAEKK